MKLQNIIHILIGTVCIAFLPRAQAISPAPDGGYPGGNTAEGQAALFNLTTGTYNTAVGFLSLRADTTGNFNTAIGAGTLLANTGDQNTANGSGVLLSNTSGTQNTANGAFALFSNTTGSFNLANGVNALLNNTTGGLNAAIGGFALFSNTTGSENNALGYGALLSNVGNGNTAIGDVAGSDLTTGSGNVCIGKDVLGVAGESDITRIRNIGSTALDTGIYVTLEAVGGDKLGYVAIPSSRRYKDEIKPMSKTSEALYALKPVNFRYKREINPDRAQRFGLIAEEVEKINPALVSYDSKGEPVTVRYESINAMLLNEFLKEHKKVAEQANTIAKLKSTVAQQRKDFEATSTQQQKGFQSRFAEQESQIQVLASDIQKMSARIEIRKPTPRIATNHP